MCVYSGNTWWCVDSGHFQRQQDEIFKPPTGTVSHQPPQTTQPKPLLLLLLLLLQAHTTMRSARQTTPLVPHVREAAQTRQRGPPARTHATVSVDAILGTAASGCVGALERSRNQPHHDNVCGVVCSEHQQTGSMLACARSTGKRCQPQVEAGMAANPHPHQPAPAAC